MALDDFYLEGNDSKLNNTNWNMTPNQFEVIRELSLICSENAFWIFMAMQSAIFKSENNSVIQTQIDNFSSQWCDLFTKYYDKNYMDTFKINISNFFDTYLSYLNHTIGGENQVCEGLLNKWKDLAGEISKSFANINPYWKEPEWRAIIGNQINILDKEIKNNVQGVYSTLNQSYNIYNRVTADIAEYAATGLIKQFAI